MPGSKGITHCGFALGRWCLRERKLLAVVPELWCQQISPPPPSPRFPFSPTFIHHEIAFMVSSAEPSALMTPSSPTCPNISTHGGQGMNHLSAPPGSGAQLLVRVLRFWSSPLECPGFRSKEQLVLQKSKAHGELWMRARFQLNQFKNVHVHDTSLSTGTTEKNHAYQYRLPHLQRQLIIHETILKQFFTVFLRCLALSSTHW